MDLETPDARSEISSPIQMFGFRNQQRSNTKKPEPAPVKEFKDVHTEAIRKLQELTSDWDVRSMRSNKSNVEDQPLSGLTKNSSIKEQQLMKINQTYEKDIERLMNQDKELKKEASDARIKLRDLQKDHDEVNKTN